MKVLDLDASREDFTRDVNALDWAPELLPPAASATDAIREAHEEMKHDAYAASHIPRPVQAAWMHTERAYRRGPITFAGGIPRGERWLLRVLWLGAVVVTAAQVLLWWLR